MTTAFVKWLSGAGLGALVLPFLVVAFSLWSVEQNIVAAIIVVAAALLSICLWSILSKRRQALVEALTNFGLAQSATFDRIPDRLIPLSIFIAAALSLYLELSVLKFQAGCLELFSFYKNFGLLSCFAGLGIGYVLSTRRESLLIVVVPLLVVQQLLLMALSTGLPADLVQSVHVLPAYEQLYMGMPAGSTIAGMLSLSCTLTVIMVLTMLLFVPLGQVCGRLMQRTSTLHGYGANLLGSLAGILAMTLTSALLLPPLAWFAVVLSVCICASLFHKKVSASLLGLALIGLVSLSWNTTFGWERVYSPYQLLERGPGAHGWSLLRAAGFYYQQVMDLSKPARLAFPELARIGAYYDLPYAFKQPPGDVAIFGAGMGNDVAAALRNGAAHVDAVEIDPCIIKWGKIYHPESPYKDPRVTAVVSDARAFLRHSPRQYDMIVFGLLDSHGLSDRASSLRMDSYVYTLESFKEARAHLKPGGVMALSFAFISKGSVKKLYRMMSEAFDGKPPLCIDSGYDYSVSYLQSKDGNLQMPAQSAVGVGSEIGPVIAKIPLLVDVSTDDWPFFYMVKRLWPFSYLPMLALLIALTYGLNRSLTSGKLVVNKKSWQYFLLGAGFMLIEAKAVTEMSLIFGNTWQVISTVIGAVLLFGFFGNLLVSCGTIKNCRLAYALVLLAIAAGWYVGGHSLMAGDWSGQLATIAILIGPVAFSGIAFSLLIADEKEISMAMSWNLLGAMLGGILEYAAMYLGYRALYLVALVIYGLALLANLSKSLVTEEADTDTRTLSATD